MLDNNRVNEAFCLEAFPFLAFHLCLFVSLPCLTCWLLSWLLVTTSIFSDSIKYCESESIAQTTPNEPTGGRCSLACLPDSLVTWLIGLLGVTWGPHQLGHIVASAAVDVTTLNMNLNSPNEKVLIFDLFPGLLSIEISAYKWNPCW